MPFFRALLSAFTFFGGHVRNRRPDRVVLVFATLATIGIASWLVLPTLIFTVIDTPSVNWVVRVPALLIFATAIASAALTWFDAQALPQQPYTTSSQIAGAIVSIFGLIILGFTAFSLFPERGPMVPESSVASSTSAEQRTVISHTRYTTTHLGGRVTSELRRPPTGPHPLRGRIVMDGHPVEDAEVQLVLNETFETDAQFTNARGEFEVRLPAGKWSLNRVTVARHVDAAESRTLLLFSEYEPKKGPSYYSRYDFRDDTGLEVPLPRPNGSRLPVFELRDAIKVVWPAWTPRVSDDRSMVPRGDIATSAIAWTPVPSTAEYEIQLALVKRKGGMSSQSTILRRRQSAARLRLADLPQIPSESSDPTEYVVAVYAFDSEGRLLTESDGGFGEIAFSLSGDVRLGEEPFVSSAPAYNPSEYFRNLERLSLVSGLLEYKQIDAARAILKEVTDEAPPGRKAAMQGALKALSGDCELALPLFDKADAEGGLGCAPLKYRKMCEEE